MKKFVINGPNLNMIGEKGGKIYGKIYARNRKRMWGRGEKLNLTLTFFKVIQKVKL